MVLMLSKNCDNVKVLRGGIANEEIEFKKDYFGGSFYDYDIYGRH